MATIGTSRFSRWWAVAGLLLLGTALAVRGGAPVINNSLAVWFVEDDPARVAYERFQARYGNDEVVVMAVGTAGSPLSAERWDQIGQAADRMRSVEGIASVVSPTEALEGPLRDLLVADGNDVALVLARFEVMEDADERRHEVLVGLRDAAGELEADDEVRWAGIGLVYDELNEASFRETPLLTGASFALVGLVLFFVSGSLGAVTLTLSSVLVSILILMGLFAVLGEQLNMVTAILPTLVLVVGTTNAVHIFQRLTSGSDASVDQALKAVFRPCLFTALTTAAGFASLAAARMAVIRDLGVYAAIGVLVTLVVSFTMSWAALRHPWFRPVDRGTGRWGQLLLKRFEHVVTRHPARVVAGAIVVAAVAAFGATRVVADTYSIEFFRADHPVRLDSEAIERAVGWYLPLEFEVETGRDGGALDPATLATVRRWQTRVEEAGLAQWSLSLADFASGDPTGAAAPEGLVGGSASAVRVTFGVPMSSARSWEARIRAIESLATDIRSSGFELGAGGYLPLYVRMMQYIVETQVLSFALAFVMVFLVMGLFLRSARLIVTAFLPNLLPVLATFGVMGALGVRLDIATVTIAAIALGIVVDDTVHFLHRYRHAFDASGDARAAVAEALDRVGPALFRTTVILTVSFAVLGLASVLSIALFGMLTALTLVFALFADLLVLPALLVLTTPTRGATHHGPGVQEAP